MLQTIILTVILSIIPNDGDFRLPEPDFHRQPFDQSIERFYFFRDFLQAGPIYSTHRLIVYEHYYHINGRRYEQCIAIHNNSHFYWFPRHPYGYCRVHVYKVNGRYEIEKITTYSNVPIKPNSLRKPEPDDEEEDCDG